MKVRERRKDRTNPSHHSTLYIVLALLIILGAGTTGYQVIEGWSWLDSFYMTVITITTVGFGEVHPLSAIGKLFTVGILFSGFGIAVVALSSFSSLLLQGELQKIFGRRAMTKEIAKLSKHYIVAGFGRTGQIVAEQLRSKKLSVVVIESDNQKISDPSGAGFLFVKGNSSDEEVLKEAGVERAEGLISVVSSDADNAFTIMTARALNSKLRIVSRAVESQSIGKLKVAGADKVIAPYELGGTRIAQAIISPAVVEFVEFVEDSRVKDIEMAGIHVPKKSPLSGQRLDSELVKKFDLIVVAIRDQAGKINFQPSAGTVIKDDDRLIVVGPPDRVDQMARATT